MGCSVTKQDIKPKTKYPFLPQHYRDVKTETVPKRQKQHSENINPAHNSEREHSQINLEIEKHIQELKDERKKKQQKENINPQKKIKAGALPIIKQQAKSPQKQIIKYKSFEGTQKQPYRAIVVPNIRGIAKPALPDFQPAKDICTFQRNAFRKGENQTSLIKSTSKLKV